MEARALKVRALATLRTIADSPSYLQIPTSDLHPPTPALL